MPVAHLHTFCYTIFFPEICKEQKPVYRGPTKFSRESSSYYVISCSNCDFVACVPKYIYLICDRKKRIFSGLENVRVLLNC